MNNMICRQPEAEEAEALLALSRTDIGLADVYTYIKLHPELPQNSRLWLGEKDGICRIYYDDGSYFIRRDLVNNTFDAVRSAKGTSLFREPPEKYRLAFMEYKGQQPDTPGFPRPLEGKEILGVLKLIRGGEKLPDYLEKRYVDMVRGINAGLCVYYGIFENGEPVSCGGIVASNEKYALIGNIFTKPENRNRGFAVQTINAVINAALKKELIPILYCEKEMTDYYEKLQFVSAKM